MISKSYLVHETTEQVSTEIVVDGNTALHVVVVVMATHLDEIFKKDSYHVN